MSHTPGPWQRTKRTVYALTQRGWKRGEPEMVNRFYADVQFGYECPQEEAEANARLIAAAPEMLEALELARSWVATRLGDTHADLIKIDSAIKKAKGEA